MITPSHNPPRDGGFKYNSPHGGRAETAVAHWIERWDNGHLEQELRGVTRVAFAKALRTPTTHRYDFLGAYTSDLGSVIDFDVIRAAGVRIGVDPLGGAGVLYWPVSRSVTVSISPRSAARWTPRSAS